MSTFVNDLDYRAAASELALMADISKAEIVAVANEYLGNDRVVVYKRKGESQKVNKIVKPEIHPVELNRDKQSKFVKDWLEMPSVQIAPAFFDAKSITVSKSGIAPVYYVKNGVFKCI